MLNLLAFCNYRRSRDLLFLHPVERTLCCGKCGTQELVFRFSLPLAVQAEQGEGLSTATVAHPVRVYKGACIRFTTTKDVML